MKLDDFFYRKLKDPCLNGKMHVLADGSVVPCFQGRREVLGSLVTDSFSQIFQKLILDPDHQVPKGIEKLQATGPSGELHLHGLCGLRGMPGVRLVPVVRGDPHRWRSRGSGGRDLHSYVLAASVSTSVASAAQGA